MLASTVAIGVLNLTAFVNLNWAHRSVVVVTLLIVLVSYVLLWFFWKGRNWARLLFLLPFTNILPIQPVKEEQP
jgi:hypothetical protein